MNPPRGTVLAKLKWRGIHVMRRPFADPLKYRELVTELPYEQYKPWEISKHLSPPANFTVRYNRAERKVRVWSVCPKAVERAIELSLKR